MDEMNQSEQNSRVKKALSAHMVMGLIAGALLYIVCLTGAVAVFHAELQRVEQSDAPEMTSISPQSVQRAISDLLAKESRQMDHLFVHLPVRDLPRTTLTADFTTAHDAFHVDADGKAVAAEENAWSEFLVALHYTLNMPALIGIVIVGALGVIMLALSLSGVLALPRIFRDSFRLRARDKNGVGLADWHNRLSVWTLPYGLAIAFTGAVIGLSSLTAYGIAADGYDGDLEAVYAPLFGAEAESNLAPAGLPNVEPALRYMQQNHPDITLTYVVLHEPKTVGQHVQLIGTLDKRLVFGEYFNFDAQGRFLNISGVADGDIGRQFAASNYNLHFGNFGGLPVKIAYLLFGLVLAVICATGTYIWLGKRARKGLHEPRLRAAWDGVVWGTPALLLITFVLRLAFGNAVPFVGIFWIGLLVAILGMTIFSGRRQTFPTVDPAV
jgi:uncharacterized iron-regulated membrane protein